MNDLRFRSITDSDLEFLVAVYASTREDVHSLDWTDDQKDQFIRMQFAAQHKHYQEHYPSAQYDIICLEETPIGRLYVDRQDSEIRVMDIALLKEYRGQGIGGRIMSSILDEGAQLQKSVTIHVQKNSPARHLYDRLGFVFVKDVGVYDFLKWEPKT